MATTNRIRLYDPERPDEREHPAEFYQARGLGRLLDLAGRYQEAAEMRLLAKEIKQAKREAA